ncbi:hypothetical protein [Micavibrio aeruginosavorus]|uniref:Uncharacterized protein n=1 Tax=Micavibrio aeruginosavorus (strain ARL-13) TaxID=856793 RepID=G2KP43_MICAA|nr:hypothetical protein [Micavibrio aeruginosavorus]AEP08551.1 hypothetical protein MICA_205 [Micavibrio aeruginosavorus ARL-13]
MRETFRNMMDRLGVGYELSPYETYPLTVYDPATGATCSAEIRMGMDPNECEAEIQLMVDIPAEGQPPMQQVIWFQCKPVVGADWDVVNARLKGDPIDREIYNWEEKCCNFFGAVARFMKLDQMPDIDALIEEEFHSRERFHDQYGGGGGKSPKIRPGQLLDMKKGRGF